MKAKDRRSEVMTLRLTASEHRYLLADARAAEVSAARYLVECWKKARKQ